jgi:hypothetical protein
MQTLFISFFSMARQLSRPPLWNYSITVRQTRSVRLLWTSDWPVAETSTWQHTTLFTRQTATPPAGFETAIPASDGPQIHALARADTWTGLPFKWVWKFRWAGLERLECKLELSAPFGALGNVVLLWFYLTVIIKALPLTWPFQTERKQCMNQAPQLMYLFLCNLRKVNKVFGLELWMREGDDYKRWVKNSDGDVCGIILKMLL